MGIEQKGNHVYNRKRTQDFCIGTMTQIFELPRAEYARAAAMFSLAEPNRTMIFSTLDGKTPGQVLVNHLIAPTACVLKTNYYNWSFIGGAPDAAWLSAVLNHLRARDSFFLNAHPALDALVPPIVPERVSERYAFADRADDGAQTVLPEGFVLRETDAALVARAMWQREIVLAMGSAENFLANGLGMCITCGDEICSEAYAVFRGDGKFELGIITAEKYRGRGFAHAACLALARKCEAQGLAVYWSCDQKNFGSVATARKLGFTSEQPYQLLFFSKHV